MLAGFLADVMHGGERRAGQFELSARFQADIGVAARQPDQGLAAFIVVFENRGPAKPHQAFHQGADTGVASVLDRLKTAQSEDEFFVLRADAKRGRILAARRKPGGEIVKSERAILAHAVGHSVSPAEAPVPGPASRASGRRAPEAQVPRQSPTPPCHTLTAAIAAVSARRVRGPSDTAATP